MKILIIEDDIGIINPLKLYLENSGFSVESLTTGEGATEEILKNEHDLIILDINLPFKDGITICKEVRKESMIPIVILTARDSEFDKVSGLEIGADDYISKPFFPSELVARINNILRRANGNNTSNKFKINNIEIDLDKVTVKKDEEEISLTKNEFEILVRIAKEDGKIVSREIIMKEIIGYDNYAYDRTIDTHIKNIRKKLNDKDFIITVRGKGYRLNK